MHARFLTHLVCVCLSVSMFCLSVVYLNKRSKKFDKTPHRVLNIPTASMPEHAPFIGEGGSGPPPPSNIGPCTSAHIPNGTSIGPAFFAGFVTDRQTDYLTRRYSNTPHLPCMWRKKPRVKFTNFLCISYLCPCLGPLLTTMQYAYIQYFRFCR